MARGKRTHQRRSAHVRRRQLVAAGEGIGGGERAPQLVRLLVGMITRSLRVLRGGKRGRGLQLVQVALGRADERHQRGTAVGLLNRSSRDLEPRQLAFLRLQCATVRGQPDGGDIVGRAGDHSNRRRGVLVALIESSRVRPARGQVEHKQTQQYGHKERPTDERAQLVFRKAALAFCGHRLR